MSYDVYIGCSRCGSDLIRPHGRNNMTSNLAQMWDKAGARLRDFDGCTGLEVLPKLQAALDYLRSDPEDFRPLEPSNGWGSYEHCVEYLERILAACCRDPEATLRVCH